MIDKTDINNLEPTSCCAPSRPQSTSYEMPAGQTPQRSSTIVPDDVVTIPGGKAFIGTARPQIPDDGESPFRSGKLRSFQIDRAAVTNARFEAFIKDTGYQTEAERFGWSFVFHTQVPQGADSGQGSAQAMWWRRVDGADWRHINGPGTEDVYFQDHPVVHVSWHDAKAFAQWAGGRLPTEAEWEHAARGGLGDAMFPWGDDKPNDDSFLPCNIWQGKFPDVNTGADGYQTTAPATSFEPNGYGLYNMVGNAWEWTAEPFKIRSLKKTARTRQAGMAGYKLLKGGSHLCHESYCFRYRIAARTGNSPDSSTSHQGLRLVYDVAAA